MASRRYTIIVADRTSGVIRRATISVRPLAFGVCAILTVPILIGMGAAWKAETDVTSLEASHSALEMENANYRAATEALSGQIESLQNAISEIGARSALDPSVARAMDKLPSLVKSRAMGGGTEVQQTARQTLGAMTTPEYTFGLL